MKQFSLDEFRAMAKKGMQELSDDDLKDISGGVLSEPLKAELRYGIALSKVYGIPKEELIKGFSDPEVMQNVNKDFPDATMDEILKYIESFWENGYVPD